MQSDVPPLPISCLTDNIHLHRNSNLKARLVTQDSQINSLRRSNHSTILSSSRKQLHSVIVGSSPYKNSACFNPPDTAKSSNKSIIDQRVSSARMLRIKQLQNQLADAHFHLNELSNENKLLKAIQKRQDAALKRYEGTNAELPRIINSHHEDLRVLQTKYKKLKSQYKDTCDSLKEKENELHSLQIQNKKLLQLSKDRHLGEREKLQAQVFDLNHRINQQDEVIQTLKRKLTLETKYLKHQLHVEMVKHKEAQKQLQDTQFKLKSLEELTEQREKRAYHASRVLFFNKDRSTISSQSLTNLNENRTDNLIKGHSFRRRQSEAITGQSLPALNGSTFITKSYVQENSYKLKQEIPVTISETLTNFEHIRNSRLQKSPVLHKAAFPTSRGSVRESPIKESQLEENEIVENQDESDVNLKNIKKTYELPKTLKQEFGYQNNDSKKMINNELEDVERANDSISIASKSRILHARLISSATEGIRTNKIQNINRSRSLTKENMENIAESDSEIKYDHDSVITVISKNMLKDNDLDTQTNCSNSDIESEMEIPITFNPDEDENITRKSDVIIDESEIQKQDDASPQLSQLFNQFYKPSNYLFNSKENNDDTEININSYNDKIELKSVNGLSVHSDVISTNFEKSIDDLEVNKNSNEYLKNIPKLWDDDKCMRNLTKENEKNVNSNQNKSLTINEQIVMENNVQKALDNSIKDTKEISELEIDEYKSKNENISSHLENCEVKNNIETKTANENSKAFDKAKLLAAIKAIDDNENIEFVDQKSRRNSATNRLQITENLYRGIPTHSRKKSEIMKEFFADS